MSSAFRHKPISNHVLLAAEVPWYAEGTAHRLYSEGLDAYQFFDESANRIKAEKPDIRGTVYVAIIVLA